MEFSRQEYWSGLPFPSPRDLPNPGIEPGSPALQADALPSELPGKPSQSLPKLRSFESVMPSNHLILCRAVFLLPSIFPSIRVFSNESAPRMRWPKYWTSLVAQRLKRLPDMWETSVRSLGWEDPLEKEMATHSSTRAWKIPWTKEPGRLQSMGSQRVGHD